MMNLSDDYKFEGINKDHLTLPDKWILSKLNKTIASINDNMEKYEFGIVGTYLYNFIWDDFCSWYIEMAKIGLNSDDENIAKSTRDVLFYVLNSITKLIHPFMPFVSEEIYQTLNGSKEISLCKETWPEIIEEFNSNDDTYMEGIMEVIKTVRALKNEANIVPSKLIDIVLIVAKEDVRNAFINNQKYIAKFTYADKLEIVDKYEPTEKGKTSILSVGEMFIPLSGMVNIEEEIAHLKNEIAKLEGEIKRCNGMLNNPGFISKAPQAKIDAEKAKLQDYENRLNIAKERLVDYQNN